MATAGYKEIFTEDTFNALFPKNGVLTDALKRDIIHFFSSAREADRAITTTDVMRLFDCPKDRARRAISSLVDQGLLVKVGIDQYKVRV